MKFVPYVLLMLSFPALGATTPASCLGDTSAMVLRQHMVCMSYGVDNAFAEISKPKGAMNAANHLKDVRKHVQMALGLQPSKLAGLKPEEARVKTLEFQIILSEVLETLARLEMRLLTMPAAEGLVQDDVKIQQLAMRLNQLIGDGHQKFR